MIILTAAQLLTLKADIASNNVQLNYNGNNTLIKNLPDSGDACNLIAAWYNGLVSTDFFGNYATVPALTILNNVSWKNFTPTDTVPTDTALNVAIWQARSLACQGMQFNLQTMLTGRAAFDATKSTLVQGLKDASQNIPSGVAGANQSGGWANIQKILCRKGTNIEKLFADIAGGNGGSNTTASTFTFEGAISGEDIFAAMHS